MVGRLFGNVLAQDGRTLLDELGIELLVRHGCLQATNGMLHMLLTSNAFAKINAHTRLVGAQRCIRRRIDLVAQVHHRRMSCHVVRELSQSCPAEEEADSGAVVDAEFGFKARLWVPFARQLED